MGIVTCRVLLHLRKFTNPTMYGSSATKPTESLHFVHFEDGCVTSQSLTPKKIEYEGYSLKSTVREDNTVSVRAEFSLSLSPWSVIGLGYIMKHEQNSEFQVL